MDDTTEHFYVNIQLRGTRKKVLIQALLADFCSEIFKQEKSICTGAKQKTTRRNFWTRIHQPKKSWDLNFAY